MTPHARLASALAEMTSPTANRSNPAFKGSKYATLDHILDHVRPILGKHGLGLTQAVYSAEGRVELRGDGSPVLDYRMTDYTWDGVRRAFHSMAEIQFAAGAKAVLPLHADAGYVKTLGEAKQLIDTLPMEIYRTRLGSAHVMGGCAMGEDPQQAVTDSLGRHHQLSNLSIHDGSLFPTSIGANPQLSIYGLTAQLASQLAERLKNA